MISNWSLPQVVQKVQGTLQGGDGAVVITGVSTDTRTIRPGDLYVPLSGEHFNGHHFIADAAAKGAVACLADQPVDADIPVILVPDCLLALGQLAAFNRQQFSGPLVAVTGSAGKTSVKQLMASVLQQKFNTWLTQGNLNNHIGVPLTLLALKPEHEAAVIELGASGAGEIAYTAQWIRPHVGIITNAAEAHIEGFGSIDGVVQTKGELLDFIQPGGTAVLNADDVYFRDWSARAAGIRQLSFGLAEQADVRAENIHTGLDGSRFELVFRGQRHAVVLPLLGLHNVRNALAVVAAGLALDMSLTDVITGLAAAEAVSGRLQWLRGKQGQRILNDAYNANPASVRAAVDVLKAADNSWLVLGDMAELGENELALHAGVGRYAREQGIRHLLACGERSKKTTEAFGAGAHWFADRKTLATYLQQQTQDQDVILVKGSRSAGMDEVIRLLQQDTEEN